MFTNISIYDLKEEINLEEDHLKDNEFTPCLPSQLESSGFVPVYAERFIHEQGKKQLIKLCVEEKIIPAATVTKKLKERVKAIEMREMRKVTKDEKAQLKDEIKIDLAPRAFSKESYIMAYIDNANGRIVIDSATESRSERLLDALREAIESLVVTPYESDADPEPILTQWLVDEKERPEDIELNGNCELRSNLDSSVIRCKQEELDADDIVYHMKAGKHVSKLAVNFEDKIEFVINNNLTLSKFSVDSGEKIDYDTDVERIDAEFALLGLELDVLINKLNEWF